MKRLLTIALMCLFAVPVVGEETAPAASPQKAVLVTGASTGIGRNLVERLAAEGYFVYAGARKESDLKELQAIKNVQALRLDVTSREDIAAAVATVTKGGRGLYALVNNAGVATFGRLVDTEEAEFDLVMAVNVYGPYRVTKAFAPLIVAGKGRITTIGSIAGILAGPQLGVYCMSKHAMEAFTDALAAEMAPLGVQVSVVEPGNYNSDIEKNAVKRIGGDMKEADRSNFKEPDEVSAAIEEALFSPNPKRRYMVVPSQDEGERTIRKQIAQLAQLNEGHAYSYDREALVKMLDEELAKASPRVGSSASRD